MTFTFTKSAASCEARICLTVRSNSSFSSSAGSGLTGILAKELKLLSSVWREVISSSAAENAVGNGMHWLPNAHVILSMVLISNAMAI